MPFEFKVTRRIEFSETDMAGIVHYSNFFRFMETAEHAFFRSLGHSIVGDRFEPPIGWPRVHASCDYKAPLRFEDEIEIQLLVVEKRSKALTYEFRIRNLTAHPPVEAARGRITAVCVVRDARGRMAAHTIPKELADQIEAAPPELFERPAHLPAR